MFSKFFKKGSTEGTEDVAKVEQDQTQKINLEKSVISLEKSLISLEKKSGVSFAGHMAKVGVGMDYSGSMDSLYKTGAVQDVLTRLMPLALKFDDNGELEVWLFSNKFVRVDPMDKNNYGTYVKNVVKKSGFSMGGTSYAPVLEDMLKKYFVEEKSTSNIPSFVIFITDGENNDPDATDKIIRKSAEHNIFIQFVGIGNSSFKYLEKLDDLEGRTIDNTGFIKVKDMSKLGDEELYNLLLDQYPDWLKEKK